MITPPRPNTGAWDCSPQITVREEGGRITIELRANRSFDEVMGARFLMGVWFACMVVFTVPLAWLVVKGVSGSAATALFMVPFWLIGLVVFRWHFCELHHAATLAIAPEGLSVTETGFWGMRRHSWAAGEIQEIRFDTHAWFETHILIRARGRQPVSITRGFYEWDLRWLAATLRMAGLMGDDESRS